MNILVEPSDYVMLRNAGDLAMLQVAMGRLARLWPDATISVLTDEPDALEHFCPPAKSLTSHGRSLWLDPDFLPGRLLHRMPRRLSCKIRHAYPQLVTNLARFKLRRSRAELKALSTFTNAVEQADLLVVTGMGGITDVFAQFASDLLETVNFALSQKTPVVMVGQGIGPLTGPLLRSRARAILPKLEMIGIREARTSEPLLRSLGVDRSKIAITGDDTIEMVAALRPLTIGKSIGINVRLANYAAIGRQALRPVATLLKEASADLSAPLVPIPISLADGDDDFAAVTDLFPQAEMIDVATNSPEAPRNIIRQIGTCRVVITGSYHAGVFALASGIPTICLAKSPYYVDKFEGLADMFGPGCELVRLEGDYVEAIREKLYRLWQEAPGLRSGLIKRADTQVESSRAAYRRIFEIVANRGKH